MPRKQEAGSNLAGVVKTWSKQIPKQWKVIPGAGGQRLLRKKKEAGSNITSVVKTKKSHGYRPGTIAFQGN